MKSDIDFHIASQIQVVAVLEWDKEFLSQNWNVYLLNNGEDNIETVLVLSRGNSNDLKTSVLRHGLGDIAGGSFRKIELITEDVLGFTNEYLVTFFQDGKMFERRFVFEANSISPKNLIKVTFANLEGVIAT